MLRGLLGDGVCELSLKAVASSDKAGVGFFGRCVWIDHPQAFEASQQLYAATCASHSWRVISVATFELVQNRHRQADHPIGHAVSR
jgi:hypothetical protein